MTLLKQHFSYILLILIWLPALMLDSTFVNDSIIDNQLLTSMIVIGLWLYLFIKVDAQLKKLMLFMVPLSWLGEVICSIWLDMYDYRNPGIPSYVPFGHAVIYITGFLINNLIVVQQNQYKIKIVLIPCFVILFIVAIVILGDSLSACLAVLFFYILHRKNYPTLYLVMSALVLYLEIVGTQLGTWYWHNNWWLFTTINPPIGAIFIYIAGDMLLTRLHRTIRFNQV